MEINTGKYKFTKYNSSHKRLLVNLKPQLQIILSLGICTSTITGFTSLAKAEQTYNLDESFNALSEDNKIEKSLDEPYIRVKASTEIINSKSALKFPSIETKYQKPTTVSEVTKKLNLGTAKDLELSDQQISESPEPITNFEQISSEVPDSLLQTKLEEFYLVQTEKPNSETTSQSGESKPDYAPGTTPPSTETPPTPTPTPAKPKPAAFALDSVQTDFGYQSDNYNLEILSVEPSVQFRLGNGNRINLKTGFINLSGQPRFKAVTIYPIRVGWEGNFRQFGLRTGATLNTFDRLPSALGFDAGVSVPILPNLIVGGTVERTPMKYAPSVLETPQKTTFTSYGPNLYWQIDSKTTLTSFFNFLQYNDGNRSQLSYTKLKRNIGNFSVAANLVTSSFEKDVSFTSGYFSPPDFLIYNGEVGWQGDITKNLNFRVQLNLGKQRVQGEYSTALYYEAQLTAKVNQSLNAFLKYSYGELDQVTYYRRPGGQDNLYNLSVLTGQVRFSF